ncbi:MAG: type II toxin-antitoxin system VapC family toxin [Methylococcales bacterium]
MKLLLDTHILLWWLSDNEQLSSKARELISKPDNDIYVSHISLWEIQIKVMTGKLEVDLNNLISQLPQNNFLQLPSHTDHILCLAKLPPYHQDPFDRMLIAQALSEPLNLITHDKYVAMYSESIILV